LADIPVVIEAFASDDHGESPAYAVAYQGDELLADLERLVGLVQKNDLLELKSDFNFGWQSFGLNLDSDCLVVKDTGEFMFTAFVDSGGYLVESRQISFSQLASQIVLFRPGMTMVIADDAKVASDIREVYERDREDMAA